MPTSGSQTAARGSMATILTDQKPIQAPDVSQADFEAFHATHFTGAAIKLFESDFLQVDPPQEQDQHFEKYYEEEEYDDGLGNYPDGIKRTLTDEQIAIFRHSELEALRRAEDKAPRKSEDTNVYGSSAEIMDLDSLTRNPDTSTHTRGTLDGDGHGGDSITKLEADSTPQGHGSLLSAVAAFKLEVKLEGPDSEEEGELASDTPNPKAANTTSKKKKKNNKRKKFKANQMQESQTPQRGEKGWFKQTIKPDLRKRTWDVVDTGMDSLDYDGLETSINPDAGPAAQRHKISYDD